MSKVLLQKAKEDAINTAIARKNSQEKPVVPTNTVPTPSLPIPVPAPKVSPVLSAVSFPTSSPPQIQQIIVYPTVDNTALIKEKAEKEKAQQLYEAEKMAREKSQEWHKEELERIKQAAKEQLEIAQQATMKAEELEHTQQLVKDDASLKRRHELALEKSKADEETIQRIMQEKEKLAQENEMLRQELEKLKKVQQEVELPSDTYVEEEEHKREPVAVPPPYDDADQPEPIELARNNEMSLTGEVAPENPVNDGSNDRCVVS